MAGKRQVTNQTFARSLGLRFARPSLASELIADGPWSRQI
jgi:hypothetical protein